MTCAFVDPSPVSGWRLSREELEWERTGTSVAFIPLVFAITAGVTLVINMQ